MDRFIFFLCLLAGVLLMISMLNKASQPGNEELIKDGQYWSTVCTLKEVDIPGGFLASNINRLDCSGVIVNVTTDRYNQAVFAYNESRFWER